MKNLRIANQKYSSFWDFVVCRDHTEEEIERLKKDKSMPPEKFDEWLKEGFPVAGFMQKDLALRYIKLQNRLPYQTISTSQIISVENLHLLRKWGMNSLSDAGGSIAEATLYTSICNELDLPVITSPMGDLHVKEKLLRQMFQGKVSDIIGIERTMELLEESKLQIERIFVK